KDEKEEKAEKKKKKDEKKELAPDPVTGLWEAAVSRPPRAEAAPLKMRLRLAGGQGSGAVTGNLRCAAVSDELVPLDGHWNRDERKLELAGLGSQGWLSLALQLEEEKLTGTLSLAGGEIAIAAEHKSSEFPVAERTERRAAPPEADEPKGKPKPPRLDERLEPLRAAFDGRTSLLVAVDREDEILECVAAFEEQGLRPILFGAEDAFRVLDRLAGRVAGILLPPVVLQADPKEGTRYRTPWADVQNAGIPVAFHSDAEEGAADLPLMAAYAVANGMSPAGAVRALTADTARLLSIDARVGRLARGLDADVLLLDGPPLAPGTAVLRTWVNGIEVKGE
ncbi:MAG: amidohydrolase family protein, partial [Planctomycetota bacterium]